MCEKQAVLATRNLVQEKVSVLCCYESMIPNNGFLLSKYY